MTCTPMLEETSIGVQLEDRAG